MTRSTEKLIHAALRDGCREHCDALIDELRRQHEECNDLARQLNESNERNGRLIAQRDALLEALKDMLNAENTYPYGGMSESEIAAIQKARAALKAVEGENT